MAVLNKIAKGGKALAKYGDDAIKFAGKHADGVVDFAVNNQDTVARGANMMFDRQDKKKAKVDAKVRYADYLAYKNGNEPDVEKFAFMLSETTGRDWTEIVENIRSHMAYKGETSESEAKARQKPALPQKEKQVLALPADDAKERIWRYWNSSEMLAMRKDDRSEPLMSMVHDEWLTMYREVEKVLSGMGAEKQLRDWKRTEGFWQSMADNTAPKIAELPRNVYDIFYTIFIPYYKPLNELTREVLGMFPTMRGIDELGGTHGALQLLYTKYMETL